MILKCCSTALLLFIFSKVALCIYYIYRRIIFHFGAYISFIPFQKLSNISWICVILFSSVSIFSPYLSVGQPQLSQQL